MASKHHEFGRANRQRRRAEAQVCTELLGIVRENAALHRQLAEARDLAERQRQEIRILRAAAGMYANQAALCQMALIEDVPHERQRGLPERFAANGCAALAARVPPPDPSVAGILWAFQTRIGRALRRMLRRVPGARAADGLGRGNGSGQS